MAVGNQPLRVIQRHPIQTFGFDAAGEKPVGVSLDLEAFIENPLKRLVDGLWQQLVAGFLQPEVFVALDVF
jgi:hypothetical protein